MVLLRRQWASTAVRSVKDAPPPRRTISTPGSSIHVPRTPQPTQRSAAPVTPPPSQSKSSLSLQKPPIVKVEDDFNGALYTAKAFGIATMIVTTGAVTTVWGIKLAMGVQDVRYVFLLKYP